MNEIADVSVAFLVADGERGCGAIALFGLLTMAVLLAPKLFGLLIALLQRRTRQHCGGVIRLLLSTMIEIFMSALVAPIMTEMAPRNSGAATLVPITP